MKPRHEMDFSILGIGNDGDAAKAFQTDGVTLTIAIVENARAAMERKVGAVEPLAEVFRCEQQA